jgi:hypothetical protein
MLRTKLGLASFAGEVWKVKLIVVSLLDARGLSRHQGSMAQRH